MAVLEKIREKTVVVLLVIGLGMFGFLFMGSDQSSVLSCNPQQQNNVGSIYGQEILPNDFSTILDQVSNQYSDASQEQQNNTAWNRLVQTTVIENVSENIGLDVSPKEIYELETGSINEINRHSAFTQFFTNQESNTFDNTLAENFISDLVNNGGQYAQFYTPFLQMEDGVIKDRLTQKYQSLIEKGMYSTTSENLSVLNIRGQNATVKYVSVPYSSQEDIEVSDEEIENYYNENISLFQNEKETRNVEYVTFTVVPSSEDDINVKAEMSDLAVKFSESEDDVNFANRNTYTKNPFPYMGSSDIDDPKFSELIVSDIGTVHGPYKLTNGQYRIAKLSEIVKRPDSVQASHILLTKENYTSDSAKTILKDIRKQVKSGTPFGLLATQLSEDKGTSKIGGELGWFKEGQMVPEFNDACFSSEIGNMKIVITQFGVHLIQITDVSKKSDKYKVVYFDKEVIASAETKDNYYAKANEFVNQLNNIPSDSTFKSFAENNNLLVREDVNIDDMKFNITALENSREIVKWMFNENTKVGDVSMSIYTCGNNYVIVSLSEINPEGDVELSSLKDVISQEVQKEKKFDLISSKISDESTLESVSTLYSVDVKTVEGVNFDNPNVNGLGFEENFVGAVNALPNGSISAVIEGNNSAIILKVISKTEPNITEVNETQKKEFANSNFTGVFYNAVMKILQDNAEVTDNRVRFY